MIDVTFMLNGNDWHELLSTYEPDQVPEIPTSLKTMDGTEHGRTRFRPVLIFSLIPLTDAQTALLFSDLNGGEVEVVYTDPNLTEVVTATMRVNTPLKSVFGLKSVDGNRYYKGGMIELRNKTVV